nr:hypothetical protein [Candidatus Sigynarchaeota archaeon]
MIIINVKNSDDFFSFLASNRSSDHVFYEIRQMEKYNGASVGGNVDLRVLHLHFLGVLGSSNVLFQHVIEVQGKKEFGGILDQLKVKMQADGFTFVEGSIREIFMSIS